MSDDILHELGLIDWAGDLVGELCDAPRDRSPGAPAEAAAQAARLVRTLQSLTPEYRAWLNAEYQLVASLPRYDDDGVEVATGTDEPDVLGRLEQLATPTREPPRRKGDYQRALLVRAVAHLLSWRGEEIEVYSDHGDGVGRSTELTEIIGAVMRAAGLDFQSRQIARDAIALLGKVDPKAAKRLGEIARERGDPTQ